LKRREAFAYQKNLASFNNMLYHASAATAQLLTIHADPRRQPAKLPNIDWRQLLEPRTFKEVFPGETPAQVLYQVLRFHNRTNEWLDRIPYVLQCTRQIKLLIELFESFFRVIGFQGLRTIVDTIGLNTRMDFLHSIILSTDEAIYLTALYDFLLREHAIDTAQQILRILHIPFQSPYELATLRNTIIDVIDPPNTSFTLFDDDDDFLYH
jgi:hypothetical protein